MIPCPACPPRGRRMPHARPMTPAELLAILRRPISPEPIVSPWAQRAITGTLPVWGPIR